MGTAADRFYSRLEPIAGPDPENGLALQGLVAALAGPGQIIDDVVRDSDTHEAWSMVLDPDFSPEWVLPWLAQFPGVRLLPADTVQEQRDRIRQAAGFYRGTVRAIREATQRTLIGTKGVQVLTRASGDRWAMTVITRTSETPDAVVAERDARSQKPVGVVLTFVTTDEPIIDEFTRTIDSITAVIDSLTVADVT